MKKTYLIFLVVVLLLCSCNPNPGRNTTDESFFDISEEGIALHDCSVIPSDGIIVVPSVANGKAVTKVQSFGFAFSDSVTVTFPKSVKSLSSNVFDSCPCLAKVVFSGTLESVDPAAFENCPDSLIIRYRGRNRTVSEFMSIFTED